MTLGAGVSTESRALAVFDLDGALLRSSFVQRSFRLMPRTWTVSGRLLASRCRAPESWLRSHGHEQVLRLLEQHRRLGHRLVVISDASPAVVSAMAGHLAADAALSTSEIDPPRPRAPGLAKLVRLEAFLGADRPLLWVYGTERAAAPMLDAADVAVKVDRNGCLSLFAPRRAGTPETPPAASAAPANTWLIEPGPLPYQDGLAEAERVGRVLHRQDIYSSGPPVDAVSGEILDFVARNTGSSVLDVGCGIGPYVDHLTRLGRHCVGVDVDAEAVDAAKRLGRDVRLMSAYDLEFADDSFDSVILVETLEHLDDYESALAEAARVARETIVVTVPDISVIPIMSKRLVVPWHLLEATHVNFFTPETLRKTLLRYAAGCHAGRLGAFFEVDGQPMHMHAVAVAQL